MTTAQQRFSNKMVDLEGGSPVLFGAVTEVYPVDSGEVYDRTPLRASFWSDYCCFHPAVWSEVECNIAKDRMIMSILIIIVLLVVVLVILLIISLTSGIWETE